MMFLGQCECITLNPSPPVFSTITRFHTIIHWLKTSTTQKPKFPLMIKQNVNNLRMTWISLWINIHLKNQRVSVLCFYHSNIHARRVSQAFQNSDSQSALFIFNRHLELSRKEFKYVINRYNMFV